MAAQRQRFEEERQLKGGEIDKGVENRIKGLRADWEKQVATLPGLQMLGYLQWSVPEGVRTVRNQFWTRTGFWCTLKR